MLHNSADNMAFWRLHISEAIYQSFVEVNDAGCKYFDHIIVAISEGADHDYRKLLQKLSSTLYLLLISTQHSPCKGAAWRTSLLHNRGSHIQDTLRTRVYFQHGAYRIV